MQAHTWHYSRQIHVEKYASPTHAELGCAAQAPLSVSWLSVNAQVTLLEEREDKGLGMEVERKVRRPTDETRVAFSSGPVVFVWVGGSKSKMVQIRQS